MVKEEKSRKACVECHAFGWGSEDGLQMKPACLSGGSGGSWCAWVAGCVSTGRGTPLELNFEPEPSIVDWFCGTESRFFFFPPIRFKTCFLLAEGTLWGIMGLFECWGSWIGDVPLCMVFFPPLRIPFSLLLSLVSAEQLRISVAWVIPRNLSLLALLAESYVIWFVEFLRKLCFLFWVCGLVGILTKHFSYQIQKDRHVIKGRLEF